MIYIVSVIRSEIVSDISNQIHLPQRNKYEITE